MENEQELIERLKQRDSRAFKTLVEEHRDRVYNTCLGFLHNSEDAEDTAQEVFMQVFDAIDTFHGESSLTTWIYRIATTKSLELIRHHKRKKRWAFFQSMMSRDEKEPDEMEGGDFFQHPGIVLEQKERAAILMKEIGKLSENQRVAFTLHKIEGLSYEEISEVMETSVSAIESLIHRATKNVRKQLYDFYRNEKGSDI